jgi:hypothetical protein
MQPYFLPYIGYWQLIAASDKFIVYDNIQYTKKGWINRNRYLLNDSDALFTIPLRKASDYLNIIDREIDREVASFTFETKLMNKLRAAYKHAPYKNRLDLIELIIKYREQNLFNYLYNSIKEICKFLNIKTEIIVSSTIPIDHSLKSENKVIALCNNLKASDYINPIGGQELYNKEVFKSNGISLYFLKPNNVEYKQFNKFVPMLSILDVLMFNSEDRIQEMLTEYALI